MRGWQQRADELARQAYAAGEPTAWFDRLYAEGAAGTTAMPWEHDDPNPLLAEWAAREQLDGRGRRAVVVGCGLGGDAEFVSRTGYATAAFDLSAAAIEQARRRHPDSTVDYRVADLRDLPPAWHGAFDLVLEIFTLQAVPEPPRSELAAGVRSLVAPGGELLLVALRHDGTASAEEGPPFPLTEEFVERLAVDDLPLVDREALDGPRWRARYRRQRPRH